MHRPVISLDHTHVDGFASVGTVSADYQPLPSVPTPIWQRRRRLSQSVRDSETFLDLSITSEEVEAAVSPSHAQQQQNAQQYLSPTHFLNVHGLSLHSPTGSDASCDSSPTHIAANVLQNPLNAWFFAGIDQAELNLAAPDAASLNNSNNSHEMSSDEQSFFSHELIGAPPASPPKDHASMSSSSMSPEMTPVPAPAPSSVTLSPEQMAAFQQHVSATLAQKGTVLSWPELVNVAQMFTLMQQKSSVVIEPTASPAPKPTVNPYEKVRPRSQTLHERPYRTVPNALKTQIAPGSPSGRASPSGRILTRVQFGEPLPDDEINDNEQGFTVPLTQSSKPGTPQNSHLQQQQRLPVDFSIAGRVWKAEYCVQGFNASTAMVFELRTLKSRFPVFPDLIYSRRRYKVLARMTVPSFQRLPNLVMLFGIVDAGVQYQCDDMIPRTAAQLDERGVCCFKLFLKRRTSVNNPLAADNSSPTASSTEEYRLYAALGFLPPGYQLSESHVPTVSELQSLLALWTSPPFRVVNAHNSEP